MDFFFLSCFLQSLPSLALELVGLDPENSKLIIHIVAAQSEIPKAIGALWTNLGCGGRSWDC
jgi:hypothetical protein